MVVDIQILCDRIAGRINSMMSKGNTQIVDGLRMAADIAEQVAKEAPPQWRSGDPVGDNRVLAVVWDGKSVELDVYDPVRARTTCMIDQNDKMVPASGWQKTEQVLCWIPIKVEDKCNS